MLPVLRTIERINLGKNVKYSEDWRLALKQDLKKQDLSIYHQLSSKIRDEQYMEKVNEARKRDYVSHFLLRLAFARTEELRRWFVSMETDLFRFRYQEEGTKEQQSFMKANNMNFQPVGFFLFQSPPDQYDETKEPLCATTDS